jgi:hypothetical protein
MIEDPSQAAIATIMLIIYVYLLKGSLRLTRDAP